MKSFFNWYRATYQARPYTTAFSTCLVKGAIADALVQRQFTNTQTKNQTKLSQNESDMKTRTQSRAQTSNMDWKRTARFATYSGAYNGSFQHLLYNVVYPRIISGACVRFTMLKSLIDACIHIPFVYFPCYYAAKFIFDGKSPLDGIKKYWGEDRAEVLKVYYKFWLPIMFCIFHFVPAEFRIGTFSVIGLAWFMILSFVSPMKSQDDEKQAQEQKQDKHLINSHSELKIELKSPKFNQTSEETPSQTISN